MATIQQTGVEDQPTIVLTDIDNVRGVTTAETIGPGPALAVIGCIGLGLSVLASRDAERNAVVAAEASTENASLESPPVPSDALSLGSNITLSPTSPVSIDAQTTNVAQPPGYDQRDSSTTPPAYHFAPGQVACHSSSSRIITRVLAERIIARPLWNTDRDGRPSGQLLQSLAVILSISPTYTFADFTALLLPKLQAKLLESRYFDPVEGEIIKAWTYIQWREPSKRFFGLRKGKLRSVDVNETNWPTVLVALRDRTLVGELRVTFWRELPLTEAERAKQLAVAQMYRATLRPYAAW
ncbi:hypothetical protein Slin14017_G033380 [Septoria linicola]|nr:hypothetical protein Slin14017_G033380 [Septoria linicola]